MPTITTTTSTRSSRFDRVATRRIVTALLGVGLAAGALFSPSAAAQEDPELAQEVPAEEVPAAAAADEPSPSGVSLFPNRVPVGGIVTVNGAGFAAGEAVTVTLNGKVVANAVTDANGFFLTTFAAGEPPGQYVVTITVGNLTYELDLEIVEEDGLFADDNGVVHEAAIEQLAAAGITSGCEPRAFCPDAAVTRAQTATFLDRLLALPPAEGDAFDDDDTSVHEGAIERLATNGITSGCAPRRFCPDAPLTRGQMATLLDRMLGLPVVEGEAFVDDDTSVHEGAIERLAAAGITSGCAPRRFCPDAPLTRGQMATLLVRSFGLPSLTALTSVSTDLDGGGNGDAERGTTASDLAPGQVVEHVTNGQLDSVEIGTRGGGVISGVCDVDGDGEHEIVLEDPTANAGALTTYDLVNDADTDIDVVWVGTRTGGSIVALADLDGDKDCDIVVLDPVTAPGAKITAKADGDADDDAIWVGAHGGITFVAVTDLDADGELDIQLRDATLPQGAAIDVHFDGADADVDIRYLP